MDNVCIFVIIYAIPLYDYIAANRTKIIIHHINVVTKPPRNIYVKYSHCGPIHFNQ